MQTIEWHRLSGNHEQVGGDAHLADDKGKQEVGGDIDSSTGGTRFEGLDLNGINPPNGAPLQECVSDSAKARSSPLYNVNRSMINTP